MKKVVCTVGLLLAVVGFPMAQEVGSRGLDAATIRSQQVRIRHDLEAPKPGYKELTASQRSELAAHLATVDRLIAGVANTSALPATDQVQLFNALEGIKAILTAAEDERRVCERYKPVGTNRGVTVCKTVAQRRAEQNAARSEVSQRDQSCAKNANGECLY